MKGILIKANVLIKNTLGLCNTKGCYEKSSGEIRIDCINVKRCLCKKHLSLYKELIEKSYATGMDLAKEEDKTSYIKVNRNIHIKSKEEKQLESLYKLLKRVRKARVKKKIRKRILKLKGVDKSGESRRVS